MFDPDGGSDPAYAKQYGSIQLDWCVEMFAYNFAAAELGIKHELGTKLQVRDVEGRPRGVQWDGMLPKEGACHNPVHPP